VVSFLPRRPTQVRLTWHLATRSLVISAFPISLGVSTSGFYAWLVCEPSQQAGSDVLLLARVHTLHASSRGTYGAPRIDAQLAREGVWRGSCIWQGCVGQPAALGHGAPPIWYAGTSALTR
jgi:hypothetical protein